MPVILVHNLPGVSRNARLRKVIPPLLDECIPGLGDGAVHDRIRRVKLDKAVECAAVREGVEVFGFGFHPSQGERLDQEPDCPGQRLVLADKVAVILEQRYK